MVVGLGGLQVFGVLILRGLLKDPIVAQVGFIKFITSINPLLQGKYPVSYTCGALCLRIANTTQ
ncbi:hypothetical protein RchiOBHm_Chr3g0487851 [Rosa chinensis]|uniref:Uncharacterized protein n=1 Tax=Rosa chinensis TaxID=74649 RepID=A0A2P6RFN6_ROSCH|nr:hypothetical protein RchiOBHm_Chr3g0487851 [Rosa chinensis]